MKTLRITGCGVRGFVGESLDPKLLIDFSSAFGTFTRGGRILIGRDTRYSSPMIRSSVAAGLLSCGCEVLDFGICPTPILQFSVPRYEAAGAVSISGGHNPMGWNAISLIDSDGAFLTPLGGESVLDTFHAGDFLKVDWQHVGALRPAEDFQAPYFDALRKTVNAEAIRKKGFVVLIDPVGGAGCDYLAPFAEALGFSLVPINSQPSGYLAREAEPRPRSAQQMASIIRHLKGDVGFLLSSDMGRVSIVTEDGEPASEEFTLSVIANHILRKRSGTVVANCCTTRMVDDIAVRWNAPLIKSPVGQASVVASVMDEGGIIGGEGSGSVVLPSFSRAFDGFLMMALILDAMAERDVEISALLQELPRYHIVKRQVVCDSRRAYHALAALREELEARGTGALDFTDGMRIDWEDGWVHVRASRTEQLIRVISEAATRAAAEQRAEEMARLIGQEL